VNKLLALFSGKTHTQNLMTKQLSPAAQAVLDAAMQHSGPAFEPLVCTMLAAALRAVADIVDDREASRQLDAIAYELEAQ
jgi:hypothetical protein